MSVVSEVKQRIDIVDLVSESVVLKKAGRNYKGLCPFHQERTPSFVVYPENQTWHCFGACSEGGDAFSFVQKMEGVDFGEALRLLARRAGVSLEPQTPEAVQEAKARDRLLELLNHAAAFFAEQLRAAAGTEARRYLEGRGITPDTAQEFRLGFAPDAWRACMTRMSADGYSRNEIVESGLVVARDDGTTYDRFRNRLVIPIHDAHGAVVGFGARSLDGSPPKYLNSPQTRVFDKSHLLYGLDRARRSIADTGTSVVVEGYMDVISLHQSGYRNVVASMGTAIGEPHLQALVKLAPRIVLALDADAAGNAATLRGLALASETLEEQGAPTFDGSLLRFERRLAAEIRVAVLPEEMDPDDVVRSEPARWESLISEARTLVDYNFEVALAEADLSDAKGKSRLAHALLPIIAAVPDPIERTHYVERLARLIQVDAKIVELELSGMRGRQGRTERTGASEATTTPVITTNIGPEEYALGFLLRSSQTAQQVDETLTQAGLECLCSADFLDAANRSLFDSVQAHGAADRLTLRSSLSAPLRQRYDEVQRLWGDAPEVEDRVLTQDGVTACLRVRERRLKSHLRLLEQALKEVDSQEERKQFETAIGSAIRQVLLLTRALAERSSLRVKS